MAKEKVKGPKGAPNKHLVARTAFLHNAAILLASQATSPCKFQASDTASEPDTTEEQHVDNKPSQTLTSGLPFLFTTQLKQVALKSQVRLHTNVKRTICKACNATLIDDHTCLKFVENLSRGAKKEHANVSVIECLACGYKSRIPIGSIRQRRKSKRAVLEGGSTAHEEPTHEEPSSGT